MPAAAPSLRPIPARARRITVTGSRVLPILPEVMSLLAGLASMDLKRFSAALLLGTLPTCFLFAFLGNASKNDPGYGIVAAVVIPLLLWPVFLLLMRKERGIKLPPQKLIAAGNRSND